MEQWESIVDRQIREAIEAGEFDDLPGKGEPIVFDDGPLDQPLAATMRRIFRDNGVTHPVLEARQAIQDELAAAHAEFERTSNEDRFRCRLHEINREIRLFNIKSPVPNFHIHIIDIESAVTASRKER